MKKGGDHRLQVKIFSFESKVQCYGSVNRQNMVPSCNNLADKMNASPDLVPFASSHLIPKVIPLPHREVDPGKLAIALSEPSE